jgi:PAS domain S-box-containing protein
MSTVSQRQTPDPEHRRLSALLAGMAACAVFLLLFALGEDNFAGRELVAARQCALLSADSLVVYSETQPLPSSSPPPLVLVRPPDPAFLTDPSTLNPDTPPTPLVPMASPLPPAAADDSPPSGDWPALLAGMQLQQKYLHTRFPRETKAMNTPWIDFTQSLEQSHRITWLEAVSLSSACRRVADTLRDHADTRRRLTWLVSGVGLLVLMILFAEIWTQLARRQTDAARIETELARRDTLLEATGEGIYQVDAKGCCLYVNPAGAELLGYQPKELWGKEMAEILYRSPEGEWENREMAAEDNPLRTALLTGDVVRREDDPLWRRDGSCFPAATLVSPIRSRYGVSGAVITFSDVTSRKQAELLRDDLTGMIVHDLRTPLTSLLSGLQALHYLGRQDAAEQEILENAIGGGETLLGMINDLLDISKLESGSLVLTKTRIHPSDVIEWALTHTAPLARQSGLRVARHLPADLPCVEADEDTLRRSLVNLLGNALKFTPQGGIVTVAAFYDAGESAIVFAVGDTGEGIPAHQVRRIFDKFGQVESRKAGRKMSTGLGLTFCKLVAEAHGGKIWVESKLGKGSRFLFTIPASPAAPTERG